MSAFELWFLFVGLPGLKDFTVGLAVIASIISAFIVIGGIVGFIGWKVDNDNDLETVYKTITKHLWWIPVLALVLALPANMLPDHRQINYLVGGYFVTNIEDIESLPPNLVKSANAFLEKMQEIEE